MEKFLLFSSALSPFLYLLREFFSSSKSLWHFTLCFQQNPNWLARSRMLFWQTFRREVEKFLLFSCVLSLFFGFSEVTTVQGFSIWVLEIIWDCVFRLHHYEVNTKHSMLFSMSYPLIMFFFTGNLTQTIYYVIKRNKSIKWRIFCHWLRASK